MLLYIFAFSQELRRVQSVIDCMIELNPHQIKHIQKTQPDFRYAHFLVFFFACIFNFFPFSNYMAKIGRSFFAISRIQTFFIFTFSSHSNLLHT